MKKQKVCHIITMLELGGAQRNTLYTVSHLDRSLYGTMLLTGPGGILDKEADALADTKVFRVKELVRPISPLKDIISVFKIYFILLKEKPDIVHTHSSKAGIVGRIAAFFARIPVVIHTYHGFGFNDFQAQLTRSIFVLAERITNPLTTKFIAVTKEDITKGIKYGIGSAEKYCLIRSGIDTSKYHPDLNAKSSFRQTLGLASNAAVVTTIGPFKPQKNLADFVKACSLVNKSLPNTVFLIIGDGEQRELITTLIEKAGLNGKVLLLGWRDDTARILQATDIFVMTSLWEGLPRSILEAMCTQLPVVANAVDGVKEIVQDGATGFLVTPRDIEALAGRIIFLINNPGTALTMGKTASAAIDRQYDINYMVKQQETLYSTLLGEHVNKN